MISLKQLIYALAVDKTRHFKKAADLCSVSQSALSTAISELESQLDLQIFERDNKKVFVTPMGEQLLERARSIKVQIDDLYQLSRSQKSPLSFPLSLGVIPTIGPFLLPKVLPRVRELYPDLELTIVEEQSHVLVEMVRNGDLDTAILALPYAHDGLHAFEFWDEDFFTVFHRHDENAKLTEITSKELHHMRLLLLKDGHCLKDHALAVCQFNPSETDNSLAGTSLYTLIQMVAGRMGTTLVPEMALDQLVGENSELKAVHLQEPGPHRRIAFVTRLNYGGVNNIELLMKLFREQLTHYQSARKKNA
ncbi:hydrogen peroxide-inducible genes activator [Gynuella sunshinyii]|uniref:Transcriptional regulator n=1 Tax=Gynuella sunshinyii YC6258 TaxID=1445510 RepID=A0A0C5V5M0_9GAMM|nr:hydrogen peroxide-inducible genes activator [Gynuella sunshinyii]AJQ94730.1 transcriptional regulator [Gynuella sunshinyii YC6258]